MPKKELTWEQLSKVAHFYGWKVKDIGTKKRYIFQDIHIIDVIKVGSIYKLIFHDYGKVSKALVMNNDITTKVMILETIQLLTYKI